MNFFEQGARFIDLGWSAWRLGWQVAETMQASQNVISRRSEMMGAALAGKSPMPIAEMARMYPEKAKAFSKGSIGAANAIGADSAKALGSALIADSFAMLDLLERSVAASAAWWAPVHKTATGNRRRLARKRRSSKS